MLSAFLETAKACAGEQARADQSKATEDIDGRKDVEEVVERNVHRARGGHSDGVGEASIGRGERKDSASSNVRCCARRKERGKTHTRIPNAFRDRLYDRVSWYSMRHQRCAISAKVCRGCPMLVGFLQVSDP